MNRTLRTGLMALAAVIALAPVAVAAPQQQVDETRAASATMTLEVDDLIVGSLTITGWDRNELQVTGTIGDDVTEFEIEGGPDRFEIVAEWEDGDRGDDSDRNSEVDIDLEIHVPFGASLELSSVTADIAIAGVSGRVDVETVTGNLDYQGSAMHLDMVTVTGTIDARTVTLAEGRFETVQGSIEFTGALGDGADADFESVMGGITLHLPADTSADFDVETMMGEIDNELGPEARSTDRWVPSKELQFSIGDGSADVTVETLQGAIRILRQ